MSRTFVITVSGSRGGAGKTRLIEKLLRCLDDCAAVKVHAGGEGELSVVEEENIGANAGKDTGRFLAAGARRAFFIHGPFDEALSAVREIIDGGRFRTVVIESNATARALDADLSFFVSAEGTVKPDAKACRENADVIVSAVPERKEPEIMSGGESDKIREALAALAVNGRVACREALGLAARLGVEAKAVGDAANELQIKIVGCQLGCF